MKNTLLALVCFVIVLFQTTPIVANSNQCNTGKNFTKCPGMSIEESMEVYLLNKMNFFWNVQDKFEIIKIYSLLKMSQNRCVGPYNLKNEDIE